MTNHLKHTSNTLAVLLFPWPWVWRYILKNIGGWQPRGRAHSWTLITLGAFPSDNTSHYIGFWTASEFLTAASLCVRCLLSVLPPMLTFCTKQVSQRLYPVLYDCCVFITWTCHAAEIKHIMSFRDFWWCFTAVNHCALMDNVRFFFFYIFLEKTLESNNLYLSSKRAS